MNRSIVAPPLQAPAEPAAPATPAAPVAPAAPAAPATPAAPVVAPPAVPAVTEPPKPAAAPAAAPAAPAKYVLVVPQTDRFDASDLSALEASAKAEGLTNEEAQAALEAEVTTREATATQFLEQTTADPDYGGAKLPETVRLANAAIDRLQPKGTPRGDQLRAVLTKTGLGNHIAFISLLAEAGKLMAEDAPPTGGIASGSGAKSTASVLYGDPKP